MSDRSSSLFEPDALLPAQFYAAFRGGTSIRGEKRLMLAVLEDALDCYQKFALATDGHALQLFEEAHSWVCSSDRGWFFSYENICEMLEINAEYLRRGLDGWRRGVGSVPPETAKPISKSDGPSLQEAG